MPPGAKDPRGKDTLILIAADSGKELGQLTVQGAGYRIGGDEFGTHGDYVLLARQQIASPCSNLIRGGSNCTRSRKWPAPHLRSRAGASRSGRGHRPCSHIVFSADGKTLAFHALALSAYVTTPVILFDTASGKKIGMLGYSPTAA